MKLIIGLGNPGEKYNTTRHNAGFMTVDIIQKKWDFPDWEFNKKFNAYLSSINPPRVACLPERQGVRFLNDTVLLVKPQTHMNLSGQTVRAILDFYKLTPEDITVIHDDIDISLGKYKIATDSSAAGHNGVQDIIDSLGTKEFRRLRIGVANDDLRTKISGKDFVLQNFSQEELEVMEEVIDELIGEIEKI